MHLSVTENGGCRMREAKPDFQERYDIIVAGLGTAGTETALIAAALGAKVLGVERLNGMGGQSTLGCIWFKWAGATPAAFHPEQVLANHQASAPIGSLEIAERMGLYEREADCAGLSLAYETIPVGLWMDGRRIAGIRLLHNGTFRDIAARIIVDATGNATLARMAGCPLRDGRSWDQAKGAVARAELWAIPGGSNKPVYANYDFNLAGNAQAYSAATVRLAAYRHAAWKVQRPDILRPAVLLGAREETRTDTEALVTLRDCLAGKRYPHPIFHTFTPEDLVRVDEDYAFESEETQNWKMLCGLPAFGYPATLPYETLIAKGVENLLVPSKHFGVSHDAGGGIRLQDAMRKTGYAAACAAVLALREGVPIRKVPYPKLRSLLAAGGLLDPPAKDRVDTLNGVSIPVFSLEDAVSALRQDITRTDEWWRAKATGDSRERAAFALWTVWKTALSGNPTDRHAWADRLAAEAGKGDRHAGNFAIALGLLGDKRACPILRGIVAAPGGTADPPIPSAYPNRIKAVCLLGRLGDCAAIPLLAALVLDDAAGFTHGLVAAKAFRTADRCRFEALSYALMSLRTLLALEPSPEIRQSLLAWNRKPLTLASERDGRNLAPALKRIIQ